MNVEVNWLGLILAMVASMVVGFVWYSPMLFAKPWMRLMGFSASSMKAAQKKMTVQYSISAVLALVTAYVLAHIMALSMNFFGYSPIQTGLTSAFWVWLGFVMPVQATQVLFGGKDMDQDAMKLFGINTGYQLVSLLAMGLVLGMVG